MTQLLLVPGSTRRGSLNAQLLRHMACELTGACEIDVLAPEQVDLPIFDQDLESEPSIRARVAALRARFSACDGLIVASPEHNGQVPAYLKNLVDWVSRLPHVDAQFDNPFLDKPLLLCSASTGWSGGALGLVHARALFSYLGCVVLGDVVTQPHAAHAWCEDGFLLDPFLDEHIASVTQRLLSLAQHFSAHHPRIPSHRTFAHESVPQA